MHGSHVDFELCKSALDFVVRNGEALDELNQRELAKIIHFLRCAVGMDVWDVINYFRSKNWNLPQELRALKKKMQGEAGKGGGE